MDLILALAVCGLIVVCYVLHLRIESIEKKLFDKID